jgi:hypothetical protein
VAILIGTVLLAVVARRTRDLSTATLTLMAVAIAINLVLGSLTVALRLPLYLDSVGTILVGALAGPWAGALTGVLANLLWSFLPIPGGSGPVAAFFAPVAAVIGLMAGFWASRGVFQVGAGDGRIGGFLALATGLGVALLGIVVAANTVGYAVAQDDPSSGDRFLVTTAVIVVLGVAAAFASGRTIFRLEGRPETARRYLVVAATVTATVLVFAILRLLFSPTGYFSSIDGADPDGPEGPNGPLFGGADLSGLALQDPLGLWAVMAVGLVVGGLVFLWARRGENVRFFPVWVGGITTALVGTTIATPIAAYVFGGVTGGGTDALVAVFRSLGLDVLQAVFLQSLLSDPLDKAISYTVVFLILGALPITVRTMYSRGEATVAE